MAGSSTRDLPVVASGNTSTRASSTNAGPASVARLWTRSGQTPRRRTRGKVPAGSGPRPVRRRDRPPQVRRPIDRVVGFGQRRRKGVAGTGGQVDRPGLDQWRPPVGLSEHSHGASDQHAGLDVRTATTPRPVLVKFADPSRATPFAGRGARPTWREAAGGLRPCGPALVIQRFQAGGHDPPRGDGEPATPQSAEYGEGEDGPGAVARDVGRTNQFEFGLGQRNIAIRKGRGDRVEGSRPRVGTRPEGRADPPGQHGLPARPGVHQLPPQRDRSPAEHDPDARQRAVGGPGRPSRRRGGALSRASGAARATASPRLASHPRTIPSRIDAGSPRPAGSPEPLQPRPGSGTRRV